VRNKVSILSVVPFLLVFLVACGGSNHNTMPSEVPVVVSISDQPSNLGVLSFDLQITGACFLTSSNATATSCSGAQNLLPGAPMTVQLENLQTPSIRTRRTTIPQLLQTRAPQEERRLFVNSLPRSPPAP
jgi:hypothetical protein